MKTSTWLAVVAIAATGVLTGPLSAQDAVIEGDAVNGEKVFRKCKACHAVGPDAKAKTGPVLNGIVGRAVAAVDGFKYSDAMLAKAEEGLVWSPENIALLLEKPKEFIPGTKMSFAGLRKEEERADVIAYLVTFPEQ